MKVANFTDIINTEEYTMNGFYCVSLINEAEQNNNYFHVYEELLKKPIEMSSSISTMELFNSRKVNYILNQLLYYDKEDKKNTHVKNYIQNGYFDLLTICDQ